MKTFLYLIILSGTVFSQNSNDCPELTTFVYDARGFKTISFYYEFFEGNSVTEYFYDDTLLVKTKKFNEKNELLGEGFYEYSPAGLLTKLENKTYLTFRFNPADKQNHMKYIPDSTSEVTENNYDNNDSLIHTKLTWYPDGSVTWESETEFKDNKPVKDICYPNDPDNRFEVIYFYDDSGRKIKTLTMHRESKYDHENRFIYDINGMLIKDETYREGKLSDYYIYKYNSAGLITGIEFYYIAEKEEKSVLSYFESYEYDPGNRLIKKCSCSITQISESK